ncbi:MAG: hypothetical protein DCC67_19065 [Planctomycetota bacterium]|nr:MAG: hypothetical protein DCC67_19065 [Planctomycetota bacterium]
MPARIATDCWALKAAARFAGVAWAIACLAPLGQAQTRLGETEIVFATRDEAAALLSARDDFVQRMSPFDRAARLKTDAEVSEQQYLQFVARNVLSWEDENREKMHRVVAAVAPQIAELRLPLPPKIYLVRTSGEEEGGAFYTRGAAIVFPTKRLADSADSLAKAFCHELFHVLSRAQPQLRQALYGAIGYQPCNEVDLPGDLAARKITNPDAPRIDQCIELAIDGQQQWAVPVLYSRSRQYDPRQGGRFFRYLEFRFLAVERDAQGKASPLLRDGQPVLIEPDEAGGLFEQIGRNTQYIIHPEEVIADNFALLVMGKRNVESPDVIHRIQQVLKDRAAAYPE